MCTATLYINPVWATWNSGMMKLFCSYNMGVPSIEAEEASASSLSE